VSGRIGVSKASTNADPKVSQDLAELLNSLPAMLSAAVESGQKIATGPVPGAARQELHAGPAMAEATARNPEATIERSVSGGE